LVHIANILCNQGFYFGDHSARVNAIDCRCAIASPKAPLAKQVTQGSVEFREVGFAYNPSEPVLHGISFAVRPGEKVALSDLAGGDCPLDLPADHPWVVLIVGK
jgi:ABC-type multidrug transport system fused ATPase/permease subunit